MEKKHSRVRELWLKQGLKLLSEKGPGALSIDLLSQRVGKSKGSFYFQFKSRDEYIRELLSYYGSLYELEEIYEPNDDTREGRIQSLVNFKEQAFQAPPRLEIAIRAWSLFDPVARAFQDKLDRKRLEFSARAYKKAGYPPEKATVKSYRDYSIYIGLQQLRSLNSEDEFKELSRKVFLPVREDG